MKIATGIKLEKTALLRVAGPCLRSTKLMSKSNKTAPLSAVTVATPVADVKKTVDIATPAVPSVVVPAVKVKTAQITDGCMTGRMSLMRKCVTEKKTYAETLTIVREKYPFGLTGTNAIKWITKHFDRIAKKLAPAAPVIATPAPVAPAPATAETPAPKTTGRRSRKSTAATA